MATAQTVSVIKAGSAKCGQASAQDSDDTCLDGSATAVSLPPIPVVPDVPPAAAAPPEPPKLLPAGCGGVSGGSGVSGNAAWLSDLIRGLDRDQQENTDLKHPALLATTTTTATTATQPDDGATGRVKRGSARGARTGDARKKYFSKNENARHHWFEPENE